MCLFVEGVVLLDDGVDIGGEVRCVCVVVLGCCVVVLGCVDVCVDGEVRVMCVGWVVNGVLMCVLVDG